MEMWRRVTKLLRENIYLLHHVAVVAGASFVVGAHVVVVVVGGRGHLVDDDFEDADAGDDADLMVMVGMMVMVMLRMMLMVMVE